MWYDDYRPSDVLTGIAVRQGNVESCSGNAGELSSEPGQGSPCSGVGSARSLLGIEVELRSSCVEGYEGPVRVLAYNRRQGLHRVRREVRL